MVKIPVEVRKAIDRFPQLYKMQAYNAINYCVRDVTDTTLRTAIEACLLVLIEEFDWGTSANSTRIDKFLAAVQTVVINAAAKYGDAMAEGLKGKLHNLGVEFKIFEQNEEKK